MLRKDQTSEIDLEKYNVKIPLNFSSTALRYMWNEYTDGGGWFWPAY